MAQRAVGNLIAGLGPGQEKKLFTARGQMARAGVMVEEETPGAARLVGAAAEMLLVLSGLDDGRCGPDEKPEAAAVAAGLLEQLVQGAYDYWAKMPGKAAKDAFAAGMVAAFAALPRSKATRRDPAALRKIQELCVTVPSMFYGSGHP
ncbi:hypothetical protein, partial [Streptomyces yunnanensis]|uniref:hypothetical protein n=1 Tax=Streptomyces yunnanensis TaxID=156453 RepID=UPI002570E26B